MAKGQGPSYQAADQYRTSCRARSTFPEGGEVGIFGSSLAAFTEKFLSPGSKLHIRVFRPYAFGE